MISFFVASHADANSYQAFLVLITLMKWFEPMSHPGSVEDEFKRLIDQQSAIKRQEWLSNGVHSHRNLGIKQRLNTLKQSSSHLIPTLSTVNDLTISPAGPSSVEISGHSFANVSSIGKRVLESISRQRDSTTSSYESCEVLYLTY